MPDIPTDEIQVAFPDWKEYPPIMNLKEAAKLSCLGESTLKRWVREGVFSTSAKKGKPLLFWRNRFVVELFKKGERTRRR